MLNKRSGFTIVELLIVIVVIAVLAAIIIVAYNGLTGRAKEAGFKADMSSAAKKIGALKIQGNDEYPATLNGTGIPGAPGSDGTAYVYNASNDRTRFCLSSSRQGVTWVVSDLNLTPMTGECNGFIAVAGPGVVVITPYSKKISLGHGQACQIKSSSELYCWGYGIYGKQGDGATTNNLVPTLVTSGPMAGKNLTNIAVGADHVCAIASGEAFCWGDNGNGRFGTGTTGTPSTPVIAMNGSAVMTGIAVTDISVGAHKTCVVASDNWSYCAGEGSRGQLGDGTTTGSTVPVAKLSTGVLSGLTITNVDARGFRSSCVIASGRAYCSGYNTTGGLGVGDTNDKTNPTAVIASGVLNGKTLTTVQSGPWGAFHCALDTLGKVYCWGPGTNGQLGNNSTSPQYSPVAVVAPLASKTVTQLTVGDAHSCAITSDNMLYCWGDNTHGQLGDGTTTYRSVPTPVTLGAMSGKTITDVAASGAIGGTYNAQFTCAIASGETYCWGRNEFGNLGDGSTTFSTTPVRVTGL